MSWQRGKTERRCRGDHDHRPRFQIGDPMRAEVAVASRPNVPLPADVDGRADAEERGDVSAGMRRKAHLAVVVEEESVHLAARSGSWRPSPEASSR